MNHLKNLCRHVTISIQIPGHKIIIYEEEFGMKMKKLVALLLATLLMTLSLGSAFALKEYVDNSMVILKTGMLTLHGWPMYSVRTVQRLSLRTQAISLRVISM